MIAERWLTWYPQPGLEVAVVSEDRSSWPFPAEPTPETARDSWDEDFELLMQAAKRGKANDCSAADRLAFELVQLLINSAGTAAIEPFMLYGAEVLADALRLDAGYLGHQVKEALR